jgi:hypothetical protein
MLPVDGIASATKTIDYQGPAKHDSSASEDSREVA